LRAVVLPVSEEFRQACPASAVAMILGEEFG